MRSTLIINVKGLSDEIIAKIRKIGKLERKEWDPNMPKAYYKRNGDQLKITGWPEFIKKLHKELKAYFYRTREKSQHKLAYERIREAEISKGGKMAKLIIKGDHDTLDEIFLMASALTDEPDITIEPAAASPNVRIDLQEDKIIIEGEESDLQKLKEKLQEHFGAIAEETLKPIVCLDQAEISKI